MRDENIGQPPHLHEWVVFSTALREGWLMLQCVGCGWHAAVEDPSPEEWSEAFSAPSRPYRWRDEARVVVKDTDPDGLFCVARAGHGPKCECYAALGVLEPEGYERIPAEVLSPPEPLSEGEREQLDDLAEFVASTDLCSLLFPVFLRSFQEHTGKEALGAALRVAGRIEKFHRMGLHCSASVVARLLREYAVRGKARV